MAILLAALQPCPLSLSIPALNVRSRRPKAWLLQIFPLGGRSGRVLGLGFDLQRGARGCVGLDSWCGVSARASDRERELQTAEELRDQLEALYEEAEQVRGRASRARARFMRLTDAVEQLRQRAAMDVRLGNEASARLLLVEKQRVMKALDAARRRADLFQQLAAKLNVAISMKETKLIAALSCARLDVGPDATGGTTVRVVSPKYDQSNEGTLDIDIAPEKLISNAPSNTDQDLLAQNHVTSMSDELTPLRHEKSTEAYKRMQM